MTQQLVTYEDALTALRARIEALDMTYEPIGEAAQVPANFLSKVLNAARTRTFGLASFIRCMEHVGLRLVVIEHLDIDATKDELGENYRKRIHRREKGKLRKQLSPAIITAAAQQYGAMGKGIKKTFCISRKRLRIIRRRAARARWKRARAITRGSADRTPSSPAAGIG